MKTDCLEIAVLNPMKLRVYVGQIVVDIGACDLSHQSEVGKHIVRVWSFLNEFCSGSSCQYMNSFNYVLHLCQLLYVSDFITFELSLCVLR